ncbi:mitochondrial distribution and morphology protein 10 [Umbelopsis sp. PMI_123]|nr:mitochondrial distribution and morphology protein 10 [Umbelopsis sp. PMI_123]
MYDFMEYCLRRYYRASGWNEENQYSNLCSWSRCLLDFTVPHGISLVMSKLPSPVFKPSYTIDALPSLNGSIGYLYTSKPLDIDTSATVDFKEILNSIRSSHPLTKYRPENTQDYLVYGRMFLPGGNLEAAYSRRISETTQYIITAFSDPRKQGASLIGMQLQRDVGRHCTEFSYTTDDGLLGLRGLYNFGHDRFDNGQWSAGAELYYGILDKSGGFSTGLRYQTLPTSVSPPISLTYTLNPIVGHMSTAYVAQVSDELVLCSRFEFSIYSYESDLAVGFEWRSAHNTMENMKLTDDVKSVEQHAAETGHTLVSDVIEESEGVAKLDGLVKARFGLAQGFALMWEGRFQNLLFSLGLTGDLSNRTNPIRSVGLELQFFA